MSGKFGILGVALAAVGLIAAGSGTALAEGHGGRFAGGGRAEGGAHFGGAGHIGGGAAHFAGGGHFGGSRYSPAPAPRAAQGRAYGGRRFAGGGAVNRAAGIPHYAAAQQGHWNRAGDERGHWDGDRRWGGDDGDRDYRDHDWHGWAGRNWGGGYWGNVWWPAAYYDVGFSWFLPVLPGVYATYWYGGLPYYYADNVYYTYDSDYNGYVATDPPPIAAQGNGDGTASEPDASGQVFMYPRNGQSAEQQAEDRQACERWAANQTASEPAAQGYADYRRAMTACAEGRGYTVK